MHFRRAADAVGGDLALVGFKDDAPRVRERHDVIRAHTIFVGLGFHLAAPGGSDVANRAAKANAIRQRGSGGHPFRPMLLTSSRAASPSTIMR